MKSKRIRFASDWVQGTFVNSTTRLDTTINISQYNHPSITPNIVITSTNQSSGAALYTAATGGAGQTGFTSPSFNAGSGWYSNDQFAITTKALDYLQFTTTAQQVLIQLVGQQGVGQGIVSGGGLVSNEIRNGAVVNINVDGTLVATVDTWQSAPLVSLLLNGSSHVVQVQHSGGVNTSFVPFTPLTNTVGTSVGQTTQLSTQFHATTVQASWRIAATSTTTYTLFRTLPGGVETTIVTGLVTGQLYANYVTGLSILIQNNIPLVNGDQATFTTDYSTVAIQYISLGTGASIGAGTYTFPVVDSGDNFTQWVSADWAQNQPLAQVSIAVGNTPTPDGSWATTVVSNLRDVTLPSGIRKGVAGLETSAVGRYAQITVQFPSVVVGNAPYIMDFTLYWWNPANEPILTNFAVGSRVAWQQNMLAYAGSISVEQAELDNYVDDWISSLAISFSVDQYLWAYAADFAIIPYTAEPQNAIITRILANLQSKQNGGSITYIAQFINWYVSGQQSSVNLTSSSGNYTATCGGVIVSQAAAQQYTVSIPTAPYNGLLGVPVGSVTTPATARYMISQFIQSILNPVGAVITPNNTGNNVTFN